jgi:hypothetical protein
MSSPTTTTVTPIRHTAITLAVARALLGLMGVLGLAGATYFSFFASPEEGGVVTAFDWFIASWKLAVSLGFVVVAVAPRMNRTLRVQLMTWLVLADIVFGLVKYFGYDERGAINIIFFAINAVLLGLFHLVRRQEQVG